MKEPKESALPYKDVSAVIGGTPDNQPAPGLAPEHEVSGTSSVTPPKGS
jgi:hypothetical protein